MAILNLNAVLRGIIASLKTKSVDNNYLLDGKGKQLKSTGRDIHLWNDELYNSPLDSFFVFNPFHELTTHEDSPSLSYLRRMLNQELNAVLMAAIPAIFNAALTIKTPNKRQSNLLTEELSDSKTSVAVVKFLDRLRKEISLNSRSRSIVDLSLYTSHPVTRDADGLKYAGMKSPLLADLSYWTPGSKVFGIDKATKAVVAALRHVIRMLMPADFEGGLYFVGNKHSTIPRNKALHDIYSDVIDHINDVLTTLKIDSIDVPVVHDDWTNGLSSVSTLMQAIPRDVFGTIGKVRSGETAGPDAPRIVISEGFGANNHGTVSSNVAGVPQGGLLGGGSNQMGMMQAPMGYMLVQVPQGNGMGMGMNMGNGMMGMGNGMMGNTLNGQTPSTPATKAVSGVPAGGMLGNHR